MDFDFTTSGELVTLQLYKNKRVYPQYSDSLISVGTSKEVTPRNINLPEGFIDVDISYSDLTTANYIKLTRSGFSFYAFITKFEHLRGDKLYRLYYKVDALRTYKNKIDFGNQFILRSPTQTELYDDLLGSTDPSLHYYQVLRSFPQPDKRVLIVQIRRDGAGEFNPADYSWTPVQPSVYNFYCIPYETNNWTSDPVLTGFFHQLSQINPARVVTMYSVPWFDTSDLEFKQAFLNEDNDHVTLRMYTTTATMTSYDRLQTDVGVPVTDVNLKKVDSTVSIVVPEGGVLTVPKGLYGEPDLALRRTIDIYSGACNYMLVNAASSIPYTQSVRGSSISTIPVIGDPEQIYISQNQNSLAASMLGDVATLATGGALIASGAGTAAGAGVLSSGVLSMVSRSARQKDAARVYSNPTAFLGSALAPFYNSRFWMVYERTRIDNAATVNSEFGYPYGMVDVFNFPTNGYIQTRECSVKSTDGSVPQWAIEEINNRLNRGIKVET